MTGGSMRCSDVWRRLGVLLFALAPWALPTPAWAHKSSDAYLVFQARDGALELRWDIALRDLDAAVSALDADGDRNVTWGEYKAALPAIDAYALAHLRVPGCRFAARDHALERRSDGTYAVLQLHADCSLAPNAAIGYSLFDDIDPTHRGIAKIERAGGAVELRLLDPGAAVPAGGAQLSAGNSAAAAPSRPEPPASFLLEGVHHIVTGYDHILFLLCLLLPAVLERTPRGWRPVANWRQALLPIVGIVSLFTIAHSITLGLAASKLVSLPSWFIEPAIAVTIIVAALDNLRPIFGRGRGLVTFLFGLIHGFGFAGVLAELDLPTAEFGWALLKFNLGLELGQLTIVGLVTPLLFVGRRSDAYRVWVLRTGSLLAIGIATWWLVQRTAPAWSS